MDKIFRDKKAIAIFIAPGILLFTLILLVPICQAVYYSLCDWNALTKPNFIGLGNYIKLFTNDDTMLTALKNSLFFMVFSAVTQQILGLLFAALLTNIKRAEISLRTFIIYLTYFHQQRSDFCGPSCLTPEWELIRCWLFLM